MGATWALGILKASWAMLWCREAETELTKAALCERCEEAGDGCPPRSRAGKVAVPSAVLRMSFPTPTTTVFPAAHGYVTGWATVLQAVACTVNGPQVAKLFVEQSSQPQHVDV